MRKGASYRDRPPHEKTDASKGFERELDMELRIADLEALVRFMQPFFEAACSECGCPNDYFEPHGCDEGCKALKELDERMAALGLFEGDAE